MAEDYKKELVDKIKKNISKGYREDSLKWALINQGYSPFVVENSLQRAIKELDNAENERLQKKREAEKPKITYQFYDENNKPINHGRKFSLKGLFRKK